MSKIAVSPNGSGTGTYTLASPNNNASHTITLPVATGELLVNTSTGVSVTGTVTAAGLTVQNANDVTTNTAEFRNDNGNRTFRFAQNTAGDADLLLEKNDGTDAVLISTHGNSYFNGGNVGIGTAAPSHKAHISTTDSTPLNVEHSNGTDVYIKLTNTADGAGNFLGASSNNLTFFTENTERMRISSTGVISGDGSGLTGVGASTTFGAVGTYAWGGIMPTVSQDPATDWAYGATSSGFQSIKMNDTQLTYIDVSTLAWYGSAVGITAQSGTWRHMGHSGKDDKKSFPGLWLRVA